eukprot:TRINITY_DN18773_c0_g1_i1.p1 TRINITY_DN18773_c0_g1~~TRINITY_DN18773_c0_g1_i1.p1  ORF type:complete len:321 (+),score=31.95 TRINITY_DN18773_c0_g1_i1:45-965(+)
MDAGKAAKRRAVDIDAHQPLPKREVIVLDDDIDNRSTSGLNDSIEIISSNSPDKLVPNIFTLDDDDDDDHTSAAPVSTSNSVDCDRMADELLARQLQEEEDNAIAQAAFQQQDRIRVDVWRNHIAPRQTQNRRGGNRRRARGRGRDATYYGNRSTVPASSWTTQSYRGPTAYANGHIPHGHQPRYHVPGTNHLPPHLQNALLSDDLSSDQHYEALLALDDTIAPKGLDYPDRYTILQALKADDIDKLPSRSCAICLEDFKAEDRVRRLPCLDMFHRECIDKHFIRSVECPICRVGVKDGHQHQSNG